MQTPSHHVKLVSRIQGDFWRFPHLHLLLQTQSHSFKQPPQMILGVQRGQSGYMILMTSQSPGWKLTCSKYEFALHFQAYANALHYSLTYGRFYFEPLVRGGGRHRVQPCRELTVCMQALRGPWGRPPSPVSCLLEGICWDVQPPGLLTSHRKLHWDVPNSSPPAMSNPRLPSLCGELEAQNSLCCFQVTLGHADLFKDLLLPLPTSNVWGVCLAWIFYKSSSPP